MGIARATAVRMTCAWRRARLAQPVRGTATAMTEAGASTAPARSSCCVPKAARARPAAGAATARRVLHATAAPGAARARNMPATRRPGQPVASTPSAHRAHACSASVSCAQKAAAAIATSNAQAIAASHTSVHPKLPAQSSPLASLMVRRSPRGDGTSPTCHGARARPMQRSCAATSFWVRSSCWLHPQGVGERAPDLGTRRRQGAQTAPSKTRLSLPMRATDPTLPCT
jgi:hypothetical protein